MERNARFQDEQTGSPSPAPRSALRQSAVAPDSSSLAQTRSSPEYDPPPPTVTLGRGPNNIRPGAPVPPHLTESSPTSSVMARTAAALGAPISAPSRTPSVPSNTSPPLDRYNQLTRGEKRHVQRSIASLGLTFREFLHAFKDAEDEDIGSDNDDEQPPIIDSSPNTPLPSTGLGNNSTTIGNNSRPSAAASTPSAPPPPSTPTPSPPPTTSTPTAAVVSTRPMVCRTEWIGEYGGEPNELENFLTRIRDLIRSETQEELLPTWIKAVLRTLPRTFTQNAAVWHQGLSDQEAMRLTSFDAWAAAMRSAFPVNRSQLRRDARSRRWKTTEETSIAYFFDTVRLLRQAFGQDQEDETLVTDIKDGLPETIIGLLRLPRVGATLAELRFELGDWEPNWRVQFRVPLRTSKPEDTMMSNSSVATTSAASPTLPFWNTTAARAPATTRLLQTTMGRSASAPSTPAAPGTQTPSSSSTRAPPPIDTAPRSISKFAAAYDPTRVIPAANGQPRRYRPPGRDTVMDLRAPCSYCGGDHFNFEHGHLVPQVRTLSVDDDDYEEYLWDGTPAEDGEGEDDEDPSLSLESGPAPSMFPAEAPKSHKTLESFDDHNNSSDSPGLYFADKSVFAVERTLRPNESAPPLAQEKRAFGKVVTLPRHFSTGTGQGYRNHVPLSTHVRVNDTDGRAMSSLLDTGASLSCIDASLLSKMGGRPTGKPMTVHGVGSSTTLGWVTLPLFIAALDPQGRHVHLEASQDFHVLPNFPPGMCLGLDFIDAHSISISPVRGRARLGRYTFSVHERLDKPFSADLELRTTTAVTIGPRTQAWVQVNAAYLAPGVDYTVVPRISVSEDEGVCLMGPNGLLTHGPVRHILLGNYGDEPFTVEQDTAVADASAARVGDLTTPAASAVFTLTPSPASLAAHPPPLRSSSLDGAGLPFDPFEEEDEEVSSLAKDAITVMVDGSYKVGVDAKGDPHAAIVELLRRHPSAFALDGRPGQVSDADMEIHLQPDTTLQSEAPRRASPDKRAAMDSAIDQLLEWDVIEPSASPVSFPVVMIKQHTKWRFCVDYRRLNTNTVPDRYPLPTIDAIFNTLCGKKIFSSLDAIRGYHQLGIHEDDRWKTAFVCHRGLFQYKRIPFGLRNAPAFFQRFMDRVLGSLRWNQAVVYIDDSVVASDTMDEHIAALEQLFDSAEKVGLKFSPAKCTFAVPSLVLLGRKISGAGVAIWKDRAQAVASLPRPTTLQELYHTLGLFGYYRAFVRGFAAVASPLTRLLKGWRYECADGRSRLVNTDGKAVTASKVPIQWGVEQQSSFETLKHAIAHPPVLAHPDPTKPYVLYCDASQDALAAILHQVHSEPASSSVEPVVASVSHLSLQHMPAGLARGQWEGWLADDPFFGPILGRVRTSTAPDEEWSVSNGVLIRRADDRLALPTAAVPFIMRAVHDELGHFGFMKTFLAVTRHFWRPNLSSTVRAWVKHCATCQRTKSVPKVGRLDISNDPTLPFETISFDLLYGFPRSQAGNDAALAIQDLFSRMVLLTPCHKEITAEGVAAIIADRVLRMGWRPKRLVTDSEARVSGSVAASLAASLGAVITPSSPYHQQANAVERAIQTTQQVLRSMAVESKSHWDKRILPAVELAMNSIPALSTGFRPFDLVFVAHPDVVHAVFDSLEHTGVSSFEERLSVAAERLNDARRAILAARTEQKRRYDARRSAIPALRPGLMVWVRLRDRPLPGAIHDKLDGRKQGPFEIVEVLSDHRVRLRLPIGMDVDSVFNVEQLDFVPIAADPFADVRSSSPAISTPLSSGRAFVPDPSEVLPTDENVPASDFEVVETESVAAESRARRAPGNLREFQLGTLAPVRSDDLTLVLRGPLFRPRRMTMGGQDVIFLERPVGFLSRLTGVAERKLVAAELELVCLAWAFHKWAHLLEGASVTIVTDHAPMERMLTSSNAIAYGPTITRCRAWLLPHLPNLRFVYRQGSRHTNVDALSRLPIDQGRSSSAGGGCAGNRPDGMMITSFLLSFDHFPFVSFRSAPTRSILTLGSSLLS